MNFKAMFMTASVTALLSFTCSSFGRERLELVGEFVPLQGTPMTSDTYTFPNISVELREDILVLHAGSVRLNYNLLTGTADALRADQEIIRGFFTETEIDGKRFSNIALRRSAGDVFLEEISDPFGNGIKVSVKNTGDEYSIWQNFYAYQTKSYILLETIIESETGVLTNYIAPIAAGTGGTANIFSIGDVDDPRFLFVPYDNDGFIRFRSDRLMGASESYEVTALFDNTTRRGMVVGSVTHDTWKTGIRIRTGLGRGNNVPVVDLRVFGGIATATTRDTEPHGSLFDYQVLSPKIFLGFFDDWRDGMEEYGQANGIMHPPLAWDHGPPFGWNSWSAIAERVDYQIYVTASDFLKNELPAFTNHQGVVYINFDSFWDNLSEQQRINAAAHVKANGQRPGIYHTPFTFWGNLEQSMEWRPGELGGRYSWFDLLLKDQRGRPVSTYAGNMGLALDPTHPGVTEINRVRLNQFRDWGYEFVKLDFLSHGAAEGQFFNRSIRTGKQAYNYGMDRMLEILGDDIHNQTFFISLSIAPIFPAHQAHGRRISCDVFGHISNAEYMLNSLSYSWWLNRHVYPYNDPDHIAVFNTFVDREPMLFNEGLTRYVSSAIAGTFMLLSDDYRNQEARERTRQIVLNDAVNSLAADGITFRPVEGNTGDRAADIFVRHDADDNVLYAAAFNFSRTTGKTMTLHLERLGINPALTWRVRNLITGREEASVTTGSLTVELAEAEPALLMFYR